MRTYLSLLCIPVILYLIYDWHFRSDGDLIVSADYNGVDEYASDQAEMLPREVFVIRRPCLCDMFGISAKPPLVATYGNVGVFLMQIRTEHHQNC